MSILSTAPLEHSVLSPSSAERWTECPGSVRASAPFPNTSSEYADEGTALHLICDHFAKIRSTVSFIGREIKVGERTFTIDEEQNEACFDAFGYVVSQLEGAWDVMAEDGITANPISDIEMIHDIRVDLGFIEPGTAGTLDVALLRKKERVLHIMDYKFGRGVKVYAAENKQMILYGLGALKKFGAENFDVIRCTVIQPRLQHVDTWEFNKADFRKWVLYFREAAAKTHDGDAPLKAGDHCRFCKAQPYCGEVRDRALQLTVAAFSDSGELLDPLTKAPVTDWDAAKLSQILKETPMIESFIKAVEEEAKRRLAAGLPVPGYKRVAGRNSREWTNEAHAIARMRAAHIEPFEQTTLSVAQAEKMFKSMKAPFPDELVVSVSGKPTIAPVADRRPELKNVSEIFGALE